MKSINKVALLGAVGLDPETRESKQGMPIASFCLATSQKRKDKTEVVQWHNCVTFGKLAEIVLQHVRKGTKMYAEGSLEYQEYEKDGEMRKTTKVIVNDISILSWENDGQLKQEATPVQRAVAKTVASDSFRDDDIPF